MYNLLIPHLFTKALLIALFMYYVANIFPISKLFVKGIFRE